MDVIRIEGGHHVSGVVTVEGAKNSALKLMAATILAPGVNTLTNVPNIADVHVMGKVLKRLGAKIDVVDVHTLRIDTSTVESWVTPYELVAQMRASTAVLGPLLGRFGKATVAMPGGCNIGARKIDMHILGLQALGVDFDLDHGEPGPGRPEVSFDDLSYHIDHMLELDGQGTIALGSDFDGSETPSWLSGAQDLPRFYELIAGRFGADVADDMFFNNAARFFARNEEL